MYVCMYIYICIYIYTSPVYWGFLKKGEPYIINRYFHSINNPASLGILHFRKLPYIPTKSLRIPWKIHLYKLYIWLMIFQQKSPKKTTPWGVSCGEKIQIPMGPWSIPLACEFWIRKRLDSSSDVKMSSSCFGSWKYSGISSRARTGL